MELFFQPSASVKNGLLLKLNMLSWLFASLDTERDTGEVGEAGKQAKVKSMTPKPVFVILQQIAPMLQTIVSNWIMDAGVVEVQIFKKNFSSKGDNLVPSPILYGRPLLKESIYSFWGQLFFFKNSPIWEKRNPILFPKVTSL